MNKLKISGVINGRDQENALTPMRCPSLEVHV